MWSSDRTVSMVSWQHVPRHTNRLSRPDIIRRSPPWHIETIQRVWQSDDEHGHDGPRSQAAAAWLPQRAYHCPFVQPRYSHIEMLSILFCLQHVAGERSPGWPTGRSDAFTGAVHMDRRPSPLGTNTATMLAGELQLRGKQPTRLGSVC